MDFGATEMGKIHIYKPFMGEIGNYVFITDYTILFSRNLPLILLSFFLNSLSIHKQTYRTIISVCIVQPALVSS